MFDYSLKEVALNNTSQKSEKVVIKNDADFFCLLPKRSHLAITGSKSGRDVSFGLRARC